MEQVYKDQEDQCGADDFHTLTEMYCFYPFHTGDVTRGKSTKFKY